MYEAVNVCWCCRNECVLVSGQKRELLENTFPVDEISFTFLWRRLSVSLTVLLWREGVPL